MSLAESPASNQDVFEHAPASRGARNYSELLDELVAVGFVNAGVAKPRTAVRTVPPGARTALSAEQEAAARRPVAAGLHLVHTRRTGN